MISWYQKPVAQVLEELSVSRASGLSSAEAENRLKKYGSNAVEAKERNSFGLIFLRQFSNVFLLILLAAGIIKVLILEYTDAALVFGITFISALIGSIQEYRAQKIASSIKKLLPKSSLVIRDGKQIAIPSHDIVPGDIVIALDGSLIPADGIIISNYGLQVNESLLTGESLPVEKELIINGLPQALPAFDRKNMVYSGSLVTAGTAHIVVIDTGMNTLVGQLAKSIKGTKQKTSHLQKDLALLSKKLLLILVFALCILSIIGILQGYPVKDLLFALLSLMVSVVPEGLPLVFAIMLARAAYELAIQHRVLIKNPRSAEVLGEMGILIMDKTGTITQNMPKVHNCITAEHEIIWREGCYQDVTSNQCAPKDWVNQKTNILWLVGIVGALLNESETVEENGKKIYKGEPLLIAFGQFAEYFGFEKKQMHEDYPKIEEIPFSSQTRLRFTAYQYDQSQVLCVLSGAPEEVLVHITDSETKYNEKLQDLLHQGQRTIALGYAIIPRNQMQNLTEISYKQLALLGIEDAIRPEAAEVVTKITNLGISIIIATGDHAATTCSIANQVALPCSDEIRRNETKLTLEEKLANNEHVFARITPAEKLELVNILHTKNSDETVGMIGDGVNDVPALHAADVGISFGASGTDTAREASDVLLMDDTITALAPAIIWGRHVRNAVQRVIYFLLTTSVSEICIILFGLALGLPVPLLANQILWLHVITDGFLDFAISMEPMRPQFLQQPSEHSLFKAISAKKIIATGVLVSFATLTLFVWSLDQNVAYARTIGFTTLTFFQWAIAWNFRSLQEPPYVLGYTKNRWLLGMTLAVFIAHCIALYVPIFQILLHFTPLTITDWLWCASLPALLFATTQAHAWFAR